MFSQDQGVSWDVQCEHWGRPGSTGTCGSPRCGSVEGETDRSPERVGVSQEERRLRKEDQKAGPRGDAGEGTHVHAKGWY